MALYLLYAGCFFLAMVVGVLLEKRPSKNYNQLFPPISDAEFMARCAPGTDPAVALGVRRVLADALGVEYHRIYPSSRLIEDLDAQ